MNTELQLKECYEAGIRKGKKEMQSIIDKLNEEKANCGNCSFMLEEIKEKQKEMLDEFKSKINIRINELSLALKYPNLQNEAKCRIEELGLLKEELEGLK